MNAPLPAHASSSVRLAGAQGNADADAIDIGLLLRRMWQRKWIVLLGGLLGAILAYAFVSTLTPQYNARALLLLDSRERQVVTSQQVVSDFKLSDPVIAGEIAVIGSNILLRKVVEELGVETLAAFDPVNAPTPAWRETLARASDAVNELFSAATEDRVDTPPATGAMDAAPSDGAADARGALTRKIGTVSRVVSGIKRDLTVRQLGDSYVIVVGMEHPDPQIAARISNTIAEQYIADQLSERVTLTRRATQWLEERVGVLRDQVVEAETAVEVYKAERLLADGIGGEAAARQAADVSGQLAIARADLATAEARVDQVRRLVEEAGEAAAAETLSSPLVSSLREARAQLLREQAELAARYGPGYPELARVRAQIERVEADLATEVGNVATVFESEAEVARIRVESLERSLGDLERQVLGVSRSAVDMRQLEREAEALRDVYEALLSRLKETSSQSALPQVQTRIIEAAEPPPVPSSPRTKLITAFGGSVGLLLGLAGAFMLEMGSRGYRSVSEAEQDLRLPVLSAVPLIKRGEHRGTLQQLIDKTKPDYEAALRQTRTKLLFATEGRQSRSILVTSTLKGEGKTTTSLALSYMMARMDKSVVFVDLDPQRSTIRSSFGWGERAGIQKLLAGEASIEEAVIRPEGMGFHAIVSPEPTAGLSDVLTSERVEWLLHELKQRYDVIIIDTPPVLALPDALVVAPHVDATLYLVAWETTPRRSVTRGVSALTDVGAEVTGLTFTKVDQKRDADWQTQGYLGY